MINNIRFKIIAGKITKIPEFYTIFAREMPDYIIRQRDRGQAEAKCLRPTSRPKFWPRGHFGLKDLTSLQEWRWWSKAMNLFKQRRDGLRLDEFGDGEHDKQRRLQHFPRRVWSGRRHQFKHLRQQQ